MARIPEPPNLGQSQSFLGWLLEGSIRLVVGLWLMAQAVGIIFYTIWHISGHDFREFMFRGYIDLWFNYSRDYLPWWFFEIPTWQSPIVWIAIIAFLGWKIWRSKKMRSKSERTYYDPQGSSYDDMDFEDLDDSTDDSSFGFDYWKWKKPSNSREVGKPKKPKRTRHSDALDLFELSEPFTMAELKKSYAKLAKKTHPDKNHGRSAALFRQVNTAFELLKKRAK